MILINNLTKIYKNKQKEDKTVFTKLNILIKENQLNCILGKSGVGKTTLLNLIGGIDQCESGKIIVNNVNYSNLSKKELNQFRKDNICFIFQDFNLIDYLTVYENIELVYKLHNVKSPKNNIIEILDKVGLKDLKDKYPDELSGGEKQRVAIARAVINKGNIILADEPTGNLDEELSDSIFKLLKEISRNKTVIIVTHNKLLAQKYADEIFDLNALKSDKNTFTNKIIPVEKRNIELISNDIPFGFKYELLKNNLLLNKYKLFFIFLILTLGLTFYGIFYSHYSSNITDASYYTLKNNNTQTIYLSKQEEISKGVYKQIHFNNNEDLYSIFTKYNKNNYLYFYDIEISPLRGLWQFSNVNEKFSYLNVVDQNQSYDLISGKLPTNKNEIMLTDYMVDLIIDNSNLDLNEYGDFLNFEINIDNSLFKITGIINTNYENNSDSQQKNFYHYKELYYTPLYVTTEFITEALTKTNYYVIKHLSTLNNASDIIFSKANMEDYLIVGSMPKTNNEVVVTLNHLNKMYSVENVENFIGKKINIYQNKTLYKEYSISGIINDDRDIMYLSSEEYEDYLLNFPNIKYISVVLDSNQSDLFLEDLYNNFNNIKINDVNIESLNSYFYIVKDVRTSLLIITSIIALFDIVVLSFIGYLQINKQKKNIGILNALGVDMWTIIKGYLIQSLLITIISLFTAYIFINFGLMQVNNSINNIAKANSTYVYLNMSQKLNIFAYAFILSIISYLFPLLRFTKLTPNQILKDL